jgi:ribosome maturation factor RimP
MRTLNPLEDKILALIEPAAADLGYRIVRIRMSGLRRKTLQIMAERLADGGMGIEDCETLSRAVAPVLDAHDPIKDEYNLEVSSPGIDRPLVSLADFARFAGYDAKLETNLMIEGRRRFRGVLAGVDSEAVLLDAPEGRYVIGHSNLREARLILTDRLIEEDLKRARAEEAADPRNTQPLSVPIEADDAPAAPLRGAKKPPAKPTKKPSQKPTSQKSTSKRKDP